VSGKDQYFLTVAYSDNFKVRKIEAKNRESLIVLLPQK
jgi:hypothetical protein